MNYQSVLEEQIREMQKLQDQNVKGRIVGSRLQNAEKHCKCIVLR